MIAAMSQWESAFWLGIVFGFAGLCLLLFYRSK